MGKQTSWLSQRKESRGGGGCTGCSSRVSPCPRPASVSPSCTEPGLSDTARLRGLQVWGSHGARRQQMMVCPSKESLVAARRGGFLACVWCWVIWLQPALIAGSTQKRKRKAEKLLRSEDCKGYTSAWAGTAGAFGWEGNRTELQMGREVVGSYPAPTLSLPRWDLWPAAPCPQAHHWASSTEELWLSPREMPNYSAGGCARA